MNVRQCSRNAAVVRVTCTLFVLISNLAGQSTPPACPTPKVTSGGSSVTTVTTAASRPTAEQIKATAERGAADPSVLLAAEPLENFGALRYRIEDYADCTGGGGCYWADLDAQSLRAQTALIQAVQARKVGERFALVLDIDETSLSSYCEMRNEDYGYIKPTFEKWIVSPDASIPLPGTLRLFHAARAAGVSIFFITGRPDEQLGATVANLRAAGYEGWTGLRLREGPETKMSTSAYKSAARQKIVDAGYKLIMNMGDQWSDLDGTPRAVINVKLPNPFYYLP